MALTIRKATAADVPGWIALLKATLDADYPDKQAYDPALIASQLQEGADVETWVADTGTQLQSALTFLPPLSANNNPVANIGRHLNRPEAFGDGSAMALLTKANEIARERQQVLVSRVFASDSALQRLYEQAQFICVGFQPFKHMNKVREGTLFYFRFSVPDAVKRFPISESLSQVSELATLVLSKLNIPNPVSIRDGVTGYPLQTDLLISEGTMDDFELWRMQAQGSNPPLEVSGLFNQGIGYLRLPGSPASKVLLGQREGKFVAGVALVFDELDRCVRIFDSFSQDDLSMGALFQQAMKLAQEQFNAVYVEVDILMTAPRLLKAVEQLGFVPIAYLPAIYSKDGSFADVVKLVKLNMVYSLENPSFTASAKAVADVIDHNFQDQKVGVAIINLLRGLPFFEGLGDGELRKIARLFTQKLYRPGEKVFSKGDSGNEAYVVMRGQIDIVIEEGAKPLASIGNGQIFGELAFLDGTPRNAIAVANQATILLVIQRSAFNNLVQREPHLGMVVMKNIAIELSNRLRKTTAAVARK
ncbi:MAG: cyclic nucleotide-binding domain-containing protein [Verrucomicrobiota bacterium]|nr:cyclic nucleotide-binding domain-containing protein [Verrucomicrobiota bacterium]